jgi:D-alanyl-D-alanine carboxypeptidase
VLQSG